MYRAKKEPRENTETNHFTQKQITVILWKVECRGTKQTIFVFHEPMLCYFPIKNKEHLFFVSWIHSNKY